MPALGMPIKKEQSANRPLEAVPAETLDEKVLGEPHPKPSEGQTQLNADASKMSRTDLLLTLTDRQLLDLAAVIKQHDGMPAYMDYVVNCMGADDDYEYGHPDNDTLLEIEDFMDFAEGKGMSFCLATALDAAEAVGV